MKLSIIYDSKSGTTDKAAKAIAAGMQKAGNVEVKTFSIKEVDEEFVKESKCVVFGSPIYMASITGDMKVWLETGSRNCALSGKIGGAFATAGYIHGGGELGIRTILDHIMCLGMLTYSAGASKGVPVIHLGPVGITKMIDENIETFEIYGQRMAEKTLEIFG